MAEGGPPIREIDCRIDHRSRERQADRERRIKEVFTSVQWYYPVHKCIGDIVQG